MKKQLLILFVSITNFIIIAQTTIDFESLTVPEVGYFNGSTEYSGSGEEETITYQEETANLYVKYADLGTFDYWSGFAYTNQTDLVTASYTNYAAYSPTGGGANSSSNYAIVFTFGDILTFDEVVTVSSIQITNAVWSYHYMNGSDGVGTGTYTTGDYFTLQITSVLENGSLGNSLNFNLADFTNGNAYIINDWTNVDLSSLGNVKGLKFELSALDNITPYYFCMDDLIYTQTIIGVQDDFMENNISVYPNPSNGEIQVTNISNAKISIQDLHGKTIYTKKNCLENEKINLKNVEQGVYFIQIENSKNVISKKIWIQY